MAHLAHPPKPALIVGRSLKLHGRPVCSVFIVLQLVMCDTADTLYLYLNGVLSQYNTISQYSWFYNTVIYCLIALAFIVAALR